MARVPSTAVAQGRPLIPPPVEVVNRACSCVMCTSQTQNEAPMAFLGSTRVFQYQARLLLHIDTGDVVGCRRPGKRQSSDDLCGTVDQLCADDECHAVALVTAPKHSPVRCTGGHVHFDVISDHVGQGSAVSCGCRLGEQEQKVTPRLIRWSQTLPCLVMVGHPLAAHCRESE